MTRIPKLSADQKSTIVFSIENKTATITELANRFEVHPRTIYRALEEAGMGMAQSDRKPGLGTQALEIMARHGISVEQLDSVLTQASTFTIPRRITTPAKTAALFHPAPERAPGFGFN